MTLTSNYGLTNEQIVRYAPSVGAPEAHMSRSGRYLYIPTLTIVNALRDIGYVPTSVMQAVSRTPGQMSFTKHLIRFRLAQYLGSTLDTVPEALIKNSHDGTSAYDVMLGLFRVVCSNGLIVRTDKLGDFKVQHRGNVLDEIIRATVTVSERANEVMSQVDEMKRIQLEDSERMLLARYAERARYGDVVEGAISNPAALLIPQHREDRGKTDLNTTLNIVQENAMRGGTRVRNGKRGREVKSIDKTIETNALIWQFGDELRKLHTGH